VLVTVQPGSLPQLVARLTVRGRPPSAPLADPMSASPLARVVRVPLRLGEDADAVARQLAALPGVAHAEPNHRRSLAWWPDDPSFADGGQWALVRVGAAEAWDAAPRRGQGVAVAIIDTGLDVAHEEFARPGAVSEQSIDVATGRRGRDAVGDASGHGTMLAGIVAATADNGRGIAGLAPQATLLAVKALDASGSGDDATIASGIVYAVESGARVINLSLGGPRYSRVLHEAVRYALERDVVVVAAAGNQGSAARMFPAAFDGVIAVGASTRADERAGFSSYGDHLSLLAPGVGIMTTQPGNRYGAVSGTSFAAAHVSAAAALLLAERPNARATAVAAALRATAERPDRARWHPERGFGIVSAARATVAQASGAYLRGIVRDADGPVAGALVRLGHPAGERRVRADDHGAFAFERLTPGRYTLVAEPPDGRPASLPIERTVHPAGGDDGLVLFAGASNALANGAFEHGWSGWTARGAMVALNAADPYDGRYAARLGSADAAASGQAALVVQAQVPSAHPRLSFAYRFGSYQPDIASFDVSIAGRAGARMLRTVATTPPATWRHVILDLAPYAGETVTLEFALRPTTSEPAWLDLDAVALVSGRWSRPDILDSYPGLPDAPPLLDGPPLAPRRVYHPIASRP
jgi:thermitase